MDSATDEACWFFDDEQDTLDHLTCYILNFVGAYKFMGLSLSLLLSACSEVLRHEFSDLLDTIKTGLISSITFERNDGKITLRTKSFKNNQILERGHSFDESDGIVIERSSSSKLKVSDGILSKNMDLVPNVPMTISVPTRIFSPRPISELDAAATTLQKVYKSYRTRRNLADCAVVVEELWWKALDFASLKRSSVSFFNIEKTETAVSRWARAKTRAAKVGKGLSKDEKARKLALQHWLEAIDPRHRYGHNLHFYYDVWSESKSCEPFFYWLDIGDGKEVNLEKCPRTPLQRQCIQYLGPKEREAYEVVVESGKLVYKHTRLLINTTEGTKLIFVLSTSRLLYVGTKKKGLFQHSSFLSGGATSAAGRLVAHDGILEAIWPYSGHYLPTEDNFKEFISFLKEHNVDLSNVKRNAVDDDCASSSSYEVTDEVYESSIETDAKQDSSTSMEAAKMKPPTPVYDISKRMSCKWSSGVGPRIGCVRDYPIDLQSMALEKVNLSPRLNPNYHGSRVPIPSPRPSPKIRLSPRLAYMGLPSPRMSISTAAKVNRDNEV